MGLFGGGRVDFEWEISLEIVLFPIILLILPSTYCCSSIIQGSKDMVDIIDNKSCRNQMNLTATDM